MVAQVIVDVVHTNVARPFSYLVPEGAEVSVGARVSVPLGRRRVDGIVVELLENPPDGLPPTSLTPADCRCMGRCAGKIQLPWAMLTANSTL